MPLLPALKSYLSLKSPALRNAGRLSVMLSVASLMGTALHLPKSYWILMTVLLVTQNGYGATRLRIVNRSVGTVVGLIIAGVALHFKIPEGYTLTLMLITTLASYLILRKNYGWATVGFTITAVYTLQLALRNAGRLSVMLSVASLMGTALHLPKSYWILMTVLLVTQNGYGATRLRIVNRSVGTVVGLIIAGVALHFKIPEGYTLTLMLITTLASYLILRKNYGWATVGFTITAVYTLQLLWLNGEQYILPRLIDTIIGCLIAFGGTVWLWPQWQSGLLRKNAHDALEAYQDAIRLILSEDPQPTPLAWQRMRVNQAHNTLYNSLNQAMQEPAFNSHYLADMKLWVTHSQFIVEHINAMTTLAREHRALPPELAQEYLQSCEIAIQRCQQRLEYDEPGSSGDANIMDAPEMQPHEGAAGTLEQHLQRVIGHLNTMHTISSMAWRQRPHHGIWLSRKLRDSKA